MYGVLLPYSLNKLRKGEAIFKIYCKNNNYNVFNFHRIKFTKFLNK